MKAIPFSIQDLKIDFKIQGFKGHFYGLMGDPELEETFNKLINDIALEALDVLWPEIEVGLVDMIKQVSTRNSEVLSVSIASYLMTHRLCITS